jgi:hypothetical protein
MTNAPNSKQTRKIKESILFGTLGFGICLGFRNSDLGFVEGPSQSGMTGLDRWKEE